nr:polymer-forming cytoskeletal protein [Kistimonas asteriae]
MWGKSKSAEKPVNTTKAVARNSDATTLISHGTEIHGDVRFHGSMHVEGRIVGDVVSDDGVLRLAEAGSIEGDIHAPNVVVNGKVKGNVYATERLELAAKAEISGNVHYALIEMVMGAQVNGSLEHMPKLAETKVSEIPLKNKDTKKTADKGRIEKQVMQVEVEGN